MLGIDRGTKRRGGAEAYGYTHIGARQAAAIANFFKDPELGVNAQGKEGVPTASATSKITDAG